MFRELGADGVVIGSLNPDGTLDMEQMDEMVHLAQGMKITMHRAFDVCRDPFEALEQCRKLGINTILTSGQRASAWEGRFLLAELIKKAEGKIEILGRRGNRTGDDSGSCGIYRSEIFSYVRKNREREQNALSQGRGAHGAAGI